MPIVATNAPEFQLQRRLDVLGLARRATSLADVEQALATTNKQEPFRVVRRASARLQVGWMPASAFRATHRPLGHENTREDRKEPLH